MGACNINWLILNDFRVFKDVFRWFFYSNLHNTPKWVAQLGLFKDKFRTNLIIKRALLYLAG